jgi:hypothetical protein
MAIAEKATTGESRIAEPAMVTAALLAPGMGTAGRATGGRKTAESPRAAKRLARMIRTGLLLNRIRSVTSACARAP